VEPGKIAVVVPGRTAVVVPGRSAEMVLPGKVAEQARTIAEKRVPHMVENALDRLVAAVDRPGADTTASASVPTNITNIS
jgi:hypothetical protein